MKKIIGIFFFFSFLADVNAQHNILYSQYFFSGILINPAYAGSQGALNLTTIFRKQWSGIEGAPCNVAVGLHSPVEKKHMALGLLYLNNSFGITTENKLLAIYAYRIHLGKGSLAFGLQGGLNAKRNNWSAVMTTQQNDPQFMPALERANNLEFGYGMYYSSMKFFAGVSSPFLYSTAVNSRFSDSPVMFCVGGLIRFSEDYAMKPSVLIKYIANSRLQADATATVYFRDIIGIGAGYRFEDAVYAFFDLHLNEQFNFGYCYDYTTSALHRYSSGTHELMLRYLFHYNLNLQSARYF